MTPGARIPKLEPSSLTDEQRSLYDAIAGGRRAQGPQLFRLVDDDGCLEGPFNAFLLQPRLGSALQALGSSVRYDTGLDDRCREIAILVVAAHWRSDFEWYAHEAVARSAGLGDAELAAVHDRRHAALTGREAVVARTVAALVTRGDLDDAEYLEAIGHVGTAGLFELLTLVGYYATLALQLRVFRVPAPDGAAPDVPVPDRAAPDVPVPDRAAPDVPVPDRAAPDVPAPNDRAPDRAARPLDTPPAPAP